MPVSSTASFASVVGARRAGLRHRLAERGRSRPGRSGARPSPARGSRARRNRARPAARAGRGSISPRRRAGASRRPCRPDWTGLSGRMRSTWSCGRGITCTLTSSPTRARRGGAGVGGGLDRADLAPHEHRSRSPAVTRSLPNELDLGRLDHGVGRPRWSRPSPWSRSFRARASQGVPPDEGAGTGAQCSGGPESSNGLVTVGGG